MRIKTGHSPCECVRMCASACLRRCVFACVYLSVPCLCMCLGVCMCVCVFASRCLHLHTCCIQMSSIRWGKERENMPNGEPNIFSICVCAPETSTIKHKYTHIYSHTHTYMHAGAQTRTQHVYACDDGCVMEGGEGRLIHVIWCRIYIHYPHMTGNS